jgi:hypothetical protein
MLKLDAGINGRGKGVDGCRGMCGKDLAGRHSECRHQRLNGIYDHGDGSMPDVAARRQ